MSKSCRIIEGNLCEITNPYNKNSHQAIDMTNKNYTFGNIIAHSSGLVVEAVGNCNENTNGVNGHRLAYIYGNYVKIKHDNGYYTLYAHGAYNTLKVKVGDRVAKGQILFYMGNTGYSFGGHVHFEVRNPKDEKIDPTSYINSDLPVLPTKKYKIGDIVTINGVYVSSTSNKKLTPSITKGTITKIIDARNPYLLDNGNIGWINEECITNTNNKIDVIYQVHDIVTNKYLSEITNYNTKNSNGYAGIIGHAIDGLKVKLSNGEKVYYQAHIKNGNWLSVVDKWDDTKDGYAGIYKKEIDGVSLKADKHTLKYRVHILNSGWLEWVSKMDIKDSKNGMAGIYGKSIDAIQIQII